MEIIALTCPSCNAPLNRKSGQNVCVCEYCWTQVVLDNSNDICAADERPDLDEAVQDNPKGSCSAIKMLDLDMAMRQAWNCIGDGRFREAFRFLNQALIIDSRCSAAYLGILMCQLKVKKREQLIRIDNYLTSCDGFVKAMHFATAEEKPELEALQHKNEEYVANLISERQAELEVICRKLPMMQQEYEQFWKRRGSSVWKLVMPSFMVAVSGIFVPFSVVGIPIFPLLAVPLTGLSVYMFIVGCKWIAAETKKDKMAKQEYADLRTEIHNLQHREEELNRWMSQRTKK